MLISELRRILHDLFAWHDYSEWHIVFKGMSRRSCRYCPAVKLRSE